MNLQMLASWFFQALIFINTFLIIATFRARELGDDSMDWQVLLKLCFWAFSFVWAIAFWRFWGMKLLRYDNIFLTLLMIMLVVSCFYAPSFAYSAGATFSVIAIICLFFAAGHFCSNESIAFSVFTSITFIGLLSILAYFLIPEVGRLKEWHGTTEVIGNRMSGIAGSPNSVGFAAAIALLIGTLYYRDLWKKGKIIFVFCMLLNCICLAISESRTSMLALILSVGAAYFANLTKERLLLFCVSALAFAGILYLIDIQSLLISLTRSGDINEITTGTGRTYIWEAAWRLIHEKPFTGWGYASSVFIFPKMEHEIGHAPPNAHNLALQILFSIGYPGLIVFIMMYATKTYYAFKFQDYFKISLLVFLFINGVTEALLFRGTVSPANIVLALVVCLDYRKKS